MKVVITIYLVLVSLIALQVQADAIERPGPKCPKKDGAVLVYIPHRKDCSKFWECSNGTPYLFNCPAGLLFNPKINVCDWPRNVDCRSRSESEEPVEEKKKALKASGVQEVDDVDGGRPRCAKKDGAFPVYIRHRRDCGKFWECSNGIPYLFSCPAGLQFNTKLNVCDWPQNVNCRDRSSSILSEIESELIEEPKKA